MAQAIANPDDLEHFAQTLAHFNGTMQEAISGLNSSFATLGE